MGTLDSVWSLHIYQLLVKTILYQVPQQAARRELQEAHHWIEIKSEHMNG